MPSLNAKLERDAIELLEKALQQAGENRQAYIDQQEQYSQETQKRALRLLEYEQQSKLSIRTGAAAFDADEDDEPLPDQIGAYRILRLIGRGGMGNVYLAERASDDFDQIVAIKVIKRRLINPEIVERFRRERQILADLNHPNIARLFDGGETQDGAPYFVMEYIDGSPLHHWLKDKKPDSVEAIEKFAEICEAVAFAHQHLIIHRDLTPPNILIDTNNQIKLIDFGIARPDDSEIVEYDNSGLSFTPGFAAPERSSDISANVLSDIYSLGKLLGLISARTADDELNAIVKKASAEDPKDRYQTALALLQDIHRFTANRPVSPLTASKTYIVKKFYHRQKLLVGLSGAFLLAILGALAGTIYAYQQANDARNLAEQRSSDTQDIANTVMFDVFDEVSKVSGTTDARMILAETAQKYLESLSSDPNASRESQIAAGRGYYRLALATGAWDPGNGGDVLAGIELLERSAEILERVYSDGADDAIRLALANTHIELMRSKGSSYIDPMGSVENGRRAREILINVEVPSAKLVTARGRQQRYLGDMLGCCANKPEEGYKMILEGINYIEKTPAHLKNDPEVQRSFNDLKNLLAGFLIFRGGDADGIMPFYNVLEEQRALAKKTKLPEDYDLEATIAHNLARTLLRMGRGTEAARVIEPIHIHAVTAFELDENDNSIQRRLAITSLASAWVAANQGDRNAANEHLDRGLELARKSHWPDGLRSVPSLIYAHRLQEASEALWVLKQTDEACQVMRQSLDMYTVYAKTFDLPVTSILYRTSRMKERVKSCPTI